jgi:hypothetical protein
MTHRILLNDTAGGAELIRRLVAAASDIALAFAGYPDDSIRAHLDHALVNMERGIADELGPTAAAQIMVALKRAVLAHKAELEALGMGSA